MKMTRILPTDKRGQVYYGPRTYREAVEAITRQNADPNDLADRLERAGFVGVARSVRREWSNNDSL